MELDDAYDNGGHIAGSEAFPARWQAAARNWIARESRAGRARIALPYGEGAREVFDLFLPDGPPLGLLVFVHGGYWRAFDRSYWSHLAQGAHEKGWAVVMPSYDLCPVVRISHITAQIARAVTAAAQEVEGPVSLSGHSAGGHLVARMLAPGMLADALVARLHHVAPISPLGDLRPLLQTTMNEDLRLTGPEARAESPVFQPVPDVAASIWVGGDERPAFLDQARGLAEAWGVENVVVRGRHHFDVIDALADPDSELVARLTR